MTEKEKLNYILNTLPESYSFIGDLIDTLKEEDQTAEYIRNISSSKTPDISDSVNYLSRYQNSNDNNWKYALRLLKYLYLTKDLNLHYNRNENCNI